MHQRRFPSLALSLAMALAATLSATSDFWRCPCVDRVMKLADCRCRRGVLQILECDPLFCEQTAEENGRLRQIYAKHWQTKLKLNKYRNIVCQLKHFEDLAPPGPSQDQ